jgi:hypothetical protein
VLMLPLNNYDVSLGAMAANNFIKKLRFSNRSDIILRLASCSRDDSIFQFKKVLQTAG